jgi:hypothetical protein
METTAHSKAALLAERDALRAEVERLRAALEAAPEPALTHRLACGIVGEMWSKDGLPLDRTYSEWHATTRAEALRRE